MLASQLSFHRRFPQAVPIQGIRPDYGTSVMASGFGFRLEWLASGPRLDLSSRSIKNIEPADPYRDGLMPRALEEVAYFVEHADDELKESHGNTLWVSFTLGPLQSIAELVGYRQMYSRIYRDPQWMHRMCEVQTQSVIAWVKAQEETLRQAGVSPGRLFLADETVGMVSEGHLREFFLPYVQRIYATSQAEVKCFHADEDVTHIPGILLEMGANLYNFNFSAVARLKRLIDHRMCLEGNLASVGVLAGGTPLEIEIAAPVDKVYDFVANVENHPRYADFVERLEITSPYRLGLGVTFNQYLHLGGETVSVPSQVIELVPLQKVVWTSPHRGYVMPVTYLFESSGPGTRVIHMAEAPWYNDPVEQAGWLEDNRRELENLKRLLEQAN